MKLEFNKLATLPDFVESVSKAMGWKESVLITHPNEAMLPGAKPQEVKTTISREDYIVKMLEQNILTAYKNGVAQIAQEKSIKEAQEKANNDIANLNLKD